LNAIQQINKQRVLYGVLNWGLGHASRSAVVIHQLLQQGCTVELASWGNAHDYLKKQFPQLKTHALTAKTIVYPKHNQLWWKLALQSGKIVSGIKHENEFVAKFCTKNAVDVVISDNCYGFYHPKIKSIFITHQLNLKTPFFQNFMRKKIQRYIAPFNEVWIPDYEGENNLAGELAHPALEKNTCFYIGPLTNLKRTNAVTEQVYSYCAIISGPEHYRTFFETKAIAFLNAQNKRALLIRGLTQPKPMQRDINDTVEAIDFVQGESLHKLIEQSQTIITLCGYSSVMDMHCLQKPCMMLPTPGQSEQEYLWKKHFGQHLPELNHVPPTLIHACTG